MTTRHSLFIGINEHVNLIELLLIIPNLVRKLGIKIDKWRAD